MPRPGDFTGVAGKLRECGKCRVPDPAGAAGNATDELTGFRGKGIQVGSCRVKGIYLHLIFRESGPDSWQM